MPTIRATAARAAFDRARVPISDDVPIDEQDASEPIETSPCIAIYLKLPQQTRARILQGDEAAIDEWRAATGEEV